MYNILIADDSMQLRSGLRHLIDWEAAGFRIGGEASDGQEALALMGKEPFDAVITDIQMPGMDGLELIRRCAQDHPGVKMIVISGYDDFAYARTAIQHGVADYLLKPIVRSELVAVLDKVRAELTRRLADNAERSRMRWTLDQQVSALREQFLVQLANGSANAAVSMRERAAQLQLDPLFADGANVRFVGAEMRIPPGRLEDDERQRDAMRLAFQTTCRDMARQEAARWLVFHDYNFPDMMFFIVGADPGGDPGGDSRARRDKTDIRLTLERYLNVDIAIGVGRPCLAPSGLRAGYASCLLERSLGGTGEADRLDAGAAPPMTGVSVPMEEIERRMTLALEKEDREAFAGLLARLFAEEGDAGMMEDSIRAMRVVLLASALCRKYNGEAPGLRDRTWTCYYAIRRFESRDSVARHVEDFAEYAISVIAEAKKSGTAAIVDAVRGYIDRHYAYELSLSAIADDYHISETYLSKIFKKQVGKTFSEYILELRMAQAVKLLERSDLNLDDIAGLVGFSNASYFSNVFKKQFGASPSSYRLREHLSAQP